jgi:hypothetical protein
MGISSSSPVSSRFLVDSLAEWALRGLMRQTGHKPCRPIVETTQTNKTMKTTYNNNIATSLLSSTEAAQWLQHDCRDMVRKTISMVESDAQEESSSFTVSITPTASTVVLMSGATVLATLVFRHWHSGYAGVRIDSIYGASCFAIADNSIINL